MRMATMISLGASAALGVGALLVAKVWLPSQTQHSQTTAAAAMPAGVPMVITASAVAYGERLDASHLRVVNVPAAAVPQGAFSSIRQVVGQPGGPPVALQSIAAHEAVLPTRISGPGARPTLAASITQGMRAYTIGITDILGGGGHIMPGDRVDVVLTRELPGDNETRGRRLISSVITQDVKVLGMDLNVDPDSDHPAVAHTATLELSPQDTIRLALAAQAGTLSLALRPAGSNAVITTRPIALDNPPPSRSRRESGPPPGITTVPAPVSSAPRPIYDPSVRSLVVSSGSTHTTLQVPADQAGR